MKTPTDLLDLARGIASRAKDGEFVEVVVARGEGTTVVAYDGSVESFEVSKDSAIGVRVVAQGREGFASAGTLEPKVVDRLLDEARENAAFAQVDPAAGVAEPDGVEIPDLQLWSDAVLATTREDKVKLALELEAATKSADPRIVAVRQAIYADSAAEAAVANNLGVEACGSESSCHISVAAMASDGQETTVGAWGDAGRDPAGLDTDRTAREAAERAVRLLGGRPVPTRRLPVVFEPRKAAALIGLVVGMLSGERVSKGRSPFANRLGEAIASSSLTIYDDPTDPKSLGAERHDGEGLACRPTTLVSGGKLVSFLHNSTTARRLGCKSTASARRGARSLPGVGAFAPHVEPGESDFESIVASMSEGLVVQSMVGLHSGVNPVSGDFSVGIEGLLVSGGEIGQPVREVTLASTLQRVLLDITHIGADLNYLPGGSVVPTIVVGEMTLAGRDG